MELIASIDDLSQLNSNKNLIIEVSPSQKGYSSVSSSEGETIIETIKPRKTKQSFKKLDMQSPKYQPSANQPKKPCRMSTKSSLRFSGQSSPMIATRGLNLKSGTYFKKKGVSNNRYPQESRSSRQGNF